MYSYRNQFVSSDSSDGEDKGLGRGYGGYTRNDQSLHITLKALTHE